MRFVVRLIALTAAFAGTVAGATRAQNSRIEPTLCRPDEQIILSCGVARQKIVSVCATKQVSKTSGYFQYRFGKPGKVELQYPADLKNSVEKFRFSSAAHSGGGRYHLRFTNDGYEYIVYDTETRGDGQAGVFARKDGKIASHLRCRAGENSHLSHDAFYVPDREPFEEIDALP